VDRTEAGNVSEFSFRGHKPALDGLRGIAIVMVLFIHFYQKPWIESNHPTFTLFFGRLVTPGAYGVELFFVLSGMLITGILLDSRDRARSLKSFYMRRLLRIFPLYYGALFVLFAILPHLISFDDGARAVAAKQGWLWAHLANVPTAGVVWDESSLFWVGHFWSLAVEERFYFLWPWIVFALPKRSCFGACVGLLLVGLGGRSVLALPMCRRDIADYLGLTLETVSRALSRLHELGILGFIGNNQRQIVLLDRQQLTHLDLQR
jgi:peptidoglycan/LPS O-acetylase OafA/YrhL